MSIINLLMHFDDVSFMRVRHSIHGLRALYNDSYRSIYMSNIFFLHLYIRYSHITIVLLGRVSNIDQVCQLRVISTAIGDLRRRPRTRE